MAEFFDIPSIHSGAHHKTSLYDLYLQTDYKKFNETFAKRYDAYEAFLRKCGIVDRIQDTNPFFNTLTTIPDLSVNQEKREALSKSLARNSFVWRGFSLALTLKRKITAHK